MEFSFQLPPPFLFNGLKHHQQVILEFIKKSIENKYSINELNLALKKVGNSMIDLYYGDLSPQEIAIEIENMLKLKSYFHKDDFYNYVFNSPKKYKTLKISDGSEWTLIFGKGLQTYLHIHPARGSKFTKRVKAISIKTAIMLKIFFEMELLNGDLVATVNKVRMDYLHESPIKNELDTIRLERVLDLL